MKSSTVLFTLLIAFAIAGCKQQSPVVKLFKQHIGKTIVLEGYDSIYKGDEVYDYGSFREKHPFVTINHIDENCGVCKVKVRDWCYNQDKIPQNDNLAHIFIFRGKDYKKYLSLTYDGEFPFYVMPSEEFTYLKNNAKIDQQVIDGGFLLNKNNKIELIGDPFVSKPMFDLFNSIITSK